ncbi:uncharacterized protein [Physcomitrium patens]|uniref:TatD related DNase n=1 Tax=Physcomitrium patens TaxID=3218 RepID=A0A7I4AE38_PHYPA|nr:putative deoxyribonuclease TATDN1 isoform X2 [Physcomitrium patens]|eukprot:XP_024389125.1 putative deoxyribonuclease TATDN1 isoform X2 [Physcomitrella patens]
MAPLKLIDIGANLTDGMFAGWYHGKQCHSPDLVHVLQRAWDAGLTRIIVTGGSLKESKEALSLADSDGRLFCTVGVHPTRCTEFEKSGDSEKHLQELLQLTTYGVARGKVVAVGECGLDYDRLQFCPADTQRRFTAGVVHSFTGTSEERDQLLAIPNLYIGINGCSLKTAENLEVMAGIPVERMMIETDSPYCDIKNTHAGIKHVKTTWPSKKKEKHDIHSLVKSRNEPCQIRQVLEVIAAYRKEQDVGGFARAIYENTCRIFFPHDIDTMADVVLSANN